MTKFSFLVLLISFCFACGERNLKLKGIEKIDWNDIKKKGVLTVLAENGPASFFIVKGKKMGFEYELLHEFAKDHDIRLNIKSWF